MTRIDLYESVTAAIVAELEKGVAPWVRPWRTLDGSGRSVPFNGASEKSYRGVNVWLLFIAARQKGYQDPRWYTYRQAQAIAGQVRAKEKSTQVVFWKPYTANVKDPVTGEPSEKKSFLLRSYRVFNAEQCDGIAALAKVPEVTPELRYKSAEALLDRHGPRVRTGGTAAFFTAGYDFIQMPPFEAFESEEYYWGTLLHELTHWTGHPSRLKRELGGRFGSEVYAAEELVAEMGAAYLCAALGIGGRLRHPEYIGSWLSVLKSDTRAVFKASSLAQVAADYLLGAATGDGALSSDATEGAEASP